MGEANHNSRSPQYQGELPEAAFDTKLKIGIAPNAAFLENVKQLREAGVDGPVAMTDSDKDVVVTLVGCWAVPTRLTNQWPQSDLPMTELCRMPLANFKAKHKENFEKNGLAAQANTIVIDEGDKKIEV